MPRGADFAGTITNNCRHPWQDIVVDFDLNCFICHCDAWLPIPVGKVDDFNSIREVFQSPGARELQEDIEQKKFTYCAVTHCGILDHHQAQDRYNLFVNIDESCNLACPSCRRELIMHDRGPVFEQKQQAVYRVMSWLDQFDRPINITMSGNGDCLASHIMRPLVTQYVPKPEQSFTIFTNGLLIKKQLPNAPILSAIREFRISVDAASAEVYEQVRRPGKWSVLMDNFDWLDQNGYSNRVILLFVVQQKNYTDLPFFVKMCEARGYRAFVSQLDDWATWTNDSSDIFTIKNGTLFDNDVLNPAHPEHQACLQTIRDSKIPYATALSKYNTPNVQFSSRIEQLL